MKKLINSVLISIILLISNSSFAAQNEAFPSLSPMLDKIMPSIVNVAAQGYEKSSIKPDENSSNPKKPHMFHSLGSGVIIDPKNGYIITNEHVIKDATTINITLNDGRRLKAKLIGSDDVSDLAVLQIKSKKLSSLIIGNSDKQHVGDFVAAIGNPFGLNNYGNSQTVTFGIISAMQRSDLNIEGIENFIQTDAAINPGNSGGALVNTKGELIGINTAIIAPYAGNVGIGFSIPVNTALDVMKQLIKYGSIHRGLMGIFVQHLTPELADAFGIDEKTQGALVTQVNKSSPAEKAGLKSGDIILEINKQQISDATQVKNIVSLMRVGSSIKMSVLRNNKLINLSAVVSDIKQHEQTLQANNPFLFGMALKNFKQQTATQGNITGIQIIGISEKSTGWRSGLRPGDVIIEVNRQKVSNLEELQTIAAKSKTSLLVHLLRGVGSMYIVVQ